MGLRVSVFTTAICFFNLTFLPVEASSKHPGHNLEGLTLSATPRHHHLYISFRVPLNLFDQGDETIGAISAQSNSKSIYCKAEVQRARANGEVLA